MFEKRRISLSLEARLDLREAYAWYEGMQNGVGRRFVAHLAETLQSISARSNSFPVVHKSARRAIVRRFPYGVFFRDLKTHLEIFAIVDLRRHPREWRRRI